MVAGSKRSRVGSARKPLLERDRELDRIGAALDSAASGTGAMVIVEGPAGVGKSRLLRAAREAPEGASLRTLGARGSELVSELSFGLVLESLGPAVESAAADERRSLFEGGAGRAQELFDSADLRSEPRREGVGVLPLLHGLFWLASNLAERSPLLLALDDLHWADAASLRFLAYLSQRLEDLPIAIVATVRTGEADEATTALLDDLSTDGASTTIQLGPLGAESVEELVRLQFRSVSPEFVEVCSEVTGGNPLLLRELLSSLADADVSVDREGAERVRLARPPNVAKLITTRLRRMGADAEALAEAAAIFSGRAPLRRVAELAQLDLPSASAAMDRLEGDEVLEQVDGELGFVHPLILHAVYEKMPSAKRGLAHGRAARQLADEGVAAEEIAAQLLKSVPTGEAWVVEVLRASAASALSRGVPEAAVPYLRRALAEPPAPTDRKQVLAELGRAETAAAVPEAVGRFEELLREADGALERAQLQLALGKAAYVLGQVPESAEYFRLGTVELEGMPEHSELQLRLESEHVNVGLQVPGLAPQIGLRLKESLERIEGDPSSPARRSLFAHGALFATITGQPWEQCFSLVRRALGDGHTSEIVRSAAAADNNDLWAITGVLSAGGELEMNDALITEAVAEAQRQGSVAAFASASYCRGVARYLAGRLTEAIADFESAIEARHLGWAQFLVAAYGCLVHALIERGELDRAAALLVELEEQGGARDELAWSFVFGARGRLHMVAGRSREALEDLERWGSMALPCPAVFSDWRHYAGLAAARLGDVERGGEMIDSELAAARSFGAAREIGNALRARGLLEGGEQGLDSLQEAVAVLEPSQNRLDLARAQVELGAAIRRLGRPTEAREPLRQGLDIAERCGAIAIAERSREELILAGGRPRRSHLTGVESLTPAELRVSAMAAEGMTNREIAESLFVTLKAIQWHLGNVYRKLEISGRRELAVAIGENHDRATVTPRSATC